MENNKYNKFVDSLYNATKSGQIKWHYLEDDEEVSSILKASYAYDNFYVSKRKFEYSQSFVTRKKFDYIVFCYSAESKHCLLVIAGGNMRHSMMLDETNVGSEPIKLLAAIRKLFPNPENIVDDIISEFGSSQE